MKAKAVLLLLSWCVPLTACATSEDPPRIVTKIQVERIPLPLTLLSCLADPEPPVTESQAVLAAYLLDLWEAWSDCSGKVTAIAKIMRTPLGTDDAAVK